jgi:hypothetical protein
MVHEPFHHDDIEIAVYNMASAVMREPHSSITHECAVICLSVVVLKPLTNVAVVVSEF